MLPLLIWIVFANFVAFGMFAHDRRAAVTGGRRISERAMLMVSLIGGSPGAFAAQEICRHKTRKQPFRMKFWMVVIFQAVAVFGWTARGLPLPR